MGKKIYKIYAEKTLQDNRVTWQLFACNLLFYLENINKQSFDFDVQRRIVANSYLDKITSTIINGEPLPAFTLTSNVKYSENEEWNIGSCEILDGLQRTFRLWSYIFLRDLSNGYSLSSTELYNALKSTDEGQRIINSKILNRAKVKALAQNEYQELRNVIASYATMDIIINLWIGLTDQEIINKMLTLNAGQRAVSSTHQYELLFLHFIRDLNLGVVRLVREREDDYNKIKRGERECGELFLSSVMIALQSYIQQTPLRIAKVNKLRIDDSVVPESASSFYTKENLEDFIAIIYKLDKKYYTDRYINEWLLRDTTLSGIFAALGDVSCSSINLSSDPVIHDSLKKITINNINLDAYKKSYNELSSVSSNVGNAVRKAIFKYFKNLFMDKPIKWSEAFNYHEYEEE